MQLPDPPDPVVPPPVPVVPARPLEPPRPALPPEPDTSAGPRRRTPASGSTGVAAARADGSPGAIPAGTIPTGANGSPGAIPAGTIPTGADASAAASSGCDAPPLPRRSPAALTAGQPANKDDNSDKTREVLNHPYPFPVGVKPITDSGPKTPGRLNRYCATRSVIQSTSAGGGDAMTSVDHCMSVSRWKFVVRLLEVRRHDAGVGARSVAAVDGDVHEARQAGRDVQDGAVGGIGVTSAMVGSTFCASLAFKNSLTYQPSGPYLRAADRSWSLRRRPG